ncbi:LamG domain-containing protein [Reichenbachiella versicolor]|uniref:family 16 glycosylhydrolase n=1 Tax=Reichenbachiella versicolor TaxID=1821036 RepID=UPI000D6E1F6A|nr:family 16 glycosylhydrolase [Reichenbachiella versicolor]
MHTLLLSVLLIISIKYTKEKTNNVGRNEKVVLNSITKEKKIFDKEPNHVLTKEMFESINPDFPSFVSIHNTTPKDKHWVKVDAMSDEFKTWDSNKWKKSTWNYGEPVFMSTDAENSGVTDGKLWIRATLDENNFVTKKVDGKEVKEHRWFKTARIHSKTKIKYPMYTEASIKAAYISAYSTYWLNNGDIKNRDEIDIIEINPRPSCECQPEFPNRMNSQYFQADENKIPATVRHEDNFLRSNLSEVNPKKHLGWHEGFHTFGLWWKDEKHIQFYLDGEPAGSVTVGEHRDGKYYKERVFTRDQEIIFDLWTYHEKWIGGITQKEHLSNTENSTFQIDWVRTWTLEDKPED